MKHGTPGERALPAKLAGALLAAMALLLVHEQAEAHGTAREARAQGHPLARVMQGTVPVPDCVLSPHFQPMHMGDRPGAMAMTRHPLLAGLIASSGVQVAGSNDRGEARCDLSWPTQDTGASHPHSPTAHPQLNGDAQSQRRSSPVQGDSVPPDTPARFAETRSFFQHKE